jgi:pimeloyl-ACP methyl ester carboxylesterase
MAWFEYQSHRIHYDVAGDGDPVLVLPGSGGTSDDVAVVRDALNPHFQTFAADLPGPGVPLPSPAPTPPLTSTATLTCFLRSCPKRSARQPTSSGSAMVARRRS